MSDFKLYQSVPHADASHDVRAPGGYEWWYFDAEDAQSDTQIVAIFLNGFVFHPGYLRAIARYRKRSTRLTPPMSSDYVCAYFCVYRNGKILHQFMTQYPSESFRSAAGGLDVEIGPNRAVRTGGEINLSLQGTPWALSWRGPQLLGEQLRADLRFTSRLPHAAHERGFFSRGLTGADHHWVIANPLCDVAGVIHGPDGPIEFSGRGYHDHNYGTGPIGPGLSRWVWGRALLEDRAMTFHLAIPRDSSLPPESHVVEADANSLRGLEHAVVRADWTRRSSLGLSFPESVRFENRLSLSRPRVVDSAPFYLRVLYECDWDGVRGRAFCEVAHPHRLRWPVLGRMIEMSIDRRACR